VEWIGPVIIGLGFLALIVWIAMDARSGDDE